MDSKSIYKRLLNWNPWWSKKEVPPTLKGERREVFRKVEKWIDEKEAKVLVGPRRAGKTTILYQLVEKIGKEKGFENILFVNMQDNVLKEVDLEAIYLSYIEHVNPSGKTYVFLDEAQEKRDWEVWVKNMYDAGKGVSFFISGSSASLLKSDYSHYLSGRIIQFEIFPLSFREFLSFKGLREVDSAESIAKAKKHYREYAKYGGFPEIFFKGEELKLDLLNEYVEDFLERDIVKRHNADRRKVEFLYKWITTNAGKPASFARISRTLGISEETVSQYISYFKEAYLVIELKEYSPSLSKQEKGQKKYYPIDPGFNTIYEVSYREEYGKPLETAVAANAFMEYGELYHSREDADVDIIYQEKTKDFFGICVTHDPGLGREKKALSNSKRLLKLAGVYFVTYDVEDKEAVPFYKWAFGLG